MTNKLKEFRFNDPVFRSTLQIVVGCSPDELFKVYPCIKKKPTGIGCYISDSGRNIIRLSKRSRSILVHELFHFICNFLKNRGMLFSEDSEEAYAYLFEYYYTNICKEIKMKL